MSSAEEPGQRRRRAVSRIGVAVSCAGGSQSFRLVGVRGVSALAPPIQHTAHKRRIRGEGFTLSFHYYRTSTAIRRAPQRRETRPVRASPAQGDNRHRAKILLVASWSGHRSGTEGPPVARRKAWKQLKGGRVWRPRASARTSALLATYDALHSLQTNPDFARSPGLARTSARHLHTSPSPRFACGSRHAERREKRLPLLMALELLVGRVHLMREAINGVIIGHHRS